MLIERCRYGHLETQVQFGIVANILTLLPLVVCGFRDGVGGKIAHTGLITACIRPCTCIHKLARDIVEAEQMEGFTAIAQPVFCGLHLVEQFGICIGSAYSRCTLKDIGVVSIKRGAVATEILHTHIMGIDEVAITTEQGIVFSHGRIVVVGLAQRILERLDAIVHPRFIIHAISDILVGRHTEVAQWKVVVQSLKSKHFALVISPCRLVALARAECAETDKHRFFLAFGLVEEIVTVFIHREACPRIVRKPTGQFVFADSLHHIIVKACGTHLVRLHGRGIVDFVDEFRGLRTADDRRVELSVIHAVAVNPSVHHLNLQFLFLCFGECGHFCTLYLFAVKIERE